MIKIKSSLLERVSLRNHMLSVFSSSFFDKSLDASQFDLQQNFACKLNNELSPQELVRHQPHQSCFAEKILLTEFYCSLQLVVLDLHMWSSALNLKTLCCCRFLLIL